MRIQTISTEPSTNTLRLKHLFATIFPEIIWCACITEKRGFMDDSLHGTGLWKKF